MSAARHSTRPSRRRKRLEGDDPTIADLAELGEAMASEDEAALALGASRANLNSLFRRSAPARAAYEAGRLRSLMALRKAQFKHAQTNASMAMFLGRIHLGQSDPREREGADGEAFDVIGAARRLRAKVAAIADAPEAADDHEGLGGAG